MLCPLSICHLECQFTGVETQPQRGGDPALRPPSSASTCWVQSNLSSGVLGRGQSPLPKYISFLLGSPPNPGMGEVMPKGRPPRGHDALSSW